MVTSTLVLLLGLGSGPSGAGSSGATPPRASKPESPSAPAAGKTPSRAGTSTSSASPEDLRLARYLHVLENWELVRDLELVELLPLIEEEGR